MTDATINRFVASGTAAERAAFTPVPPTPASGPAQGYIWIEEDTDHLYVRDDAAGAYIGPIGHTGSQAWTAVISPSQITSDQNDYNPTSLSTAACLRLNSDASRNVTGLQGGASGRLLAIYNVGSNAIVLNDESASSTAANRFALDTDLTLSGDTSCVLQYDGTSSRWRLIALGKAGVSAAVGGGSGATDNVIIRADGAGGATVQGGGVMTLSDAGVLGFPDGVRQTFNPDGTNAGLNVGAQAGDPSSLSDGDVWYNSTAGILKARTASATVPLTGYVVIASGSTGTVANIDFTNLGGYSELLFIARDITTSSSGFRQVLASVDNGSTFYTTSGNYIRVNSDGTQTNDTVLAGTSSAGTTARGTVMHLVNNVSGYDKVAINPFGTILFVASANAINALRYQNSAGNLNGGTYVLLGR